MVADADKIKCGNAADVKAPRVASDGQKPPALENQSGQIQKPMPNPTRYGDWEKGGRCIDF